MTPACRAPNPAALATRWRRLRGALAAGLAALLVACGPGVGGTGTGTSLTPAEALGAFGASAASLCGSALAPSLQCGAVTGAPASAPGSATPLAPLQFLADDGAAARAVARIVADGVELELPCERLHFTGTWGAVPGQPARFYGWVQRSSDGESQLASLSALPADAGITVTLADAAGTALAPPRLLRPVSAPPPAACRN